MRNAECGLRNGEAAAARSSTPAVFRAGRSGDLQQRTRVYALGVIKLVESLPRTRTADVIGRQLLRSATLVGANYRAACRARSAADFIAKMGIVEEEADECLYWLDLLAESRSADHNTLAPLIAEGNQIVAIVVASIRTARGTKR
jgi:four helix bundle protein